MNTTSRCRLTRSRQGVSEVIAPGGPAGDAGRGARPQLVAGGPQALVAAVQDGDRTRSRRPVQVVPFDPHGQVRALRVPELPGGEGLSEVVAGLGPTRESLAAPGPQAGCPEDTAAPRARHER